MNQEDCKLKTQIDFHLISNNEIIRCYYYHNTDEDLYNFFQISKSMLEDETKFIDIFEAVIKKDNISYINYTTENNIEYRNQDTSK